MNGITEIPLTNELDTAVANLKEAGFEFTVVCSDTETSCPAWETPRAA